MTVETPVEISSIKTPNLKDRIHNNGCCGELELIKFYSYTLVSSSAVLFLDVDSMLMNPITPLVNELLSAPSVEAMYTKDWGMVQPGMKAGAQGGFLLLKPSMETFDLFRRIVLNVPFNEPGSKGWGGSGLGPFWGAMTFQGLLPYVYEEYEPGDFKGMIGKGRNDLLEGVERKGRSVEIDRCVYNVMMDNPKTKDDSECRGPVKGVTDCQDCRMQRPEDITTFHFTLCQKPWNCYVKGPRPWCEPIHKTWFKYRRELEEERGVYEPKGDHMEGFCTKQGKGGYIPIMRE